ncbi:hypothetical protein DMZ48_02185 [Robertkochia solimangrovi]|nr:hypothetical protein DMZ48_02185 [Robertkochia solimangrovi]
MKLRNLIFEVSCMIFILLFAYAAVSKLLEFDKFRIQLTQSPVLTSLADILVWVIPILEILIALALFTTHYRLIAMYLSFSLMLMFTAYILIILNLSPYIPCSCGGILEKLNWKAHLVFNMILLMISILSILIYPKFHPPISRNQNKPKYYRDEEGDTENLEKSRYN